MISKERKQITTETTETTDKKINHCTYKIYSANENRCNTVNVKVTH